MVRPRPGGDDEALRHDGLMGAVGAFNLQGVGVDEAPAAAQHAHPVALVEAMAHGHLRAHDALCGAQHGGQLHLVVFHQRREHGVGAVLRERTDVVPQGLRGDGAPVGAAAADVVVALDDRDGEPGLGGLHRRAFAAGARADDDHVEVRRAFGRCAELGHRGGVAPSGVFARHLTHCGARAKPLRRRCGAVRSCGRGRARGGARTTARRGGRAGGASPRRGAARRSR